MRLIDADFLIEELHHMIEGDADLRKDYEYMGIDDCIRSIPTAYSIEKVVAELEKEGRCCARYSVNTDGVKSIPTKDAVAIVRKGGVE